MYEEESFAAMLTSLCLITEYSVDSIQRTILLKILLLKKNFKKSLLKILFTNSKQYF